jgi:LruC domain-containing protein
MKTNSKFLSLLVAATTLIGCSKDTDTSFQTSSADDTPLEELVVSQTFNWSSSIKGNVEVVIDAPSYLTTEGQTVELLDENGILLDEQVVTNSSVSFYVSRPQTEGKIFAYYPNTQEQIEITSEKIVFELKEISLNGLQSNLFQSTKKSGSKNKTQGTNMVDNGDFGNSVFPIDTSLYTNLRSLGSWYSRDNNGTTINVNGNMAFTSNNPNSKADILQGFAVEGNYMFDFNYDFSGNGGFFVLLYNASKSFIGYTTVFTSGNSGHTNFITSNSVRFIQLYGFCAQGSWLDNVSLVETVEPDDDGDGVPNRKDAFPNDPLRAYKASFPTLGKQILAFEDLWPSTGDYDFNDLVIENTVEFRKNANNQLVDAIVNVKVLGLGAGLSSGLGIHLLKGDKTPFNSNLIAGINGSATLDPAVTNGIIVFNDDRKALKPFYNNNGFGPSGAPQTFTFIISFNANAGGQFILPDFYIYRTNERGRETHQSGFPATSAASTALIGTNKDNGSYRTTNGLPWVVEVVSPNAEYFRHPIEKVDMGTAYPKFKAWAQSNGKRYIGWMLLGKEEKLYTIK